MWFAVGEKWCVVVRGWSKVVLVFVSGAIFQNGKNSAIVQFPNCYMLVNLGWYLYPINQKMLLFF